MKGIIGVLAFFPVYIILIKTLIRDVKFIKRNKFDHNSLEFFLYMLFILYFSYDLMLYFNWFSPVAMSRDYEWLTYLAMYLASRQLLFRKLKKEEFEKNPDYYRGL